MAADDPPPFFRTWGGMYALVLIALALWIGLFTAISKAFE
jgi:hypothetical protein